MLQYTPRLKRASIDKQSKRDEAHLPLLRDRSPVNLFLIRPDKTTCSY